MFDRHLGWLEIKAFEPDGPYHGNVLLRLPWLVKGRVYRCTACGKRVTRQRSEIESLRWCYEKGDGAKARPSHAFRLPIWQRAEGTTT